VRVRIAASLKDLFVTLVMKTVVGVWGLSDKSSTSVTNIRFHCSSGSLRRPRHGHGEGCLCGLLQVGTRQREISLENDDGRA
jgi:hypothetical protein